MIDPVLVKGASAHRLPEPGRYRHFKGNEYDLLMVARHTETEEWLAVYCAVKEPDRIWVRPVEMFAEHVEDGDASRPRFELAHDAQINDEAESGVLQKVRSVFQRFGRISKAGKMDRRDHGYSRAASCGSTPTS